MSTLRNAQLRHDRLLPEDFDRPGCECINSADPRDEIWEPLDSCDDDSGEVVVKCRCRVCGVQPEKWLSYRKALVQQCCICKRYKFDGGRWDFPTLQWLNDHEQAKVSHGYCPVCAKREAESLREQMEAGHA